jgi:hypothetical protein
MAVRLSDRPVTANRVPGDGPVPSLCRLVATMALLGDLHAGWPFQFGDELAFAQQRGEPVVLVLAEVGEPGAGREQVTRSGTPLPSNAAEPRWRRSPAR